MSRAHYVDSTSGLAATASALAQSDVLGIDTEFERTRTYYARPALIQLTDGDGVWLVDPLAISDLAPLGALLAAAGTTHVLHACSEDLEVLARATGAPPRRLFDTQIAAAFCGYGFSLGYRALVEATLGVVLDKGETRSNWLRRPLTDRQVAYATRDAMHLLPMHRLLAERLDTLGRRAWCDEECTRLCESAAGAAPALYYRRVRQARELDRRALAVLRELCTWREREARTRDVARKFVAEDALLVAIATAAPCSRAELDAVAGLPRGLRSRHAEAIIGCVEAGIAIPEADLPEPLARVSRSDAARRSKQLRGLVRERAEALGMPAEFLLQRRLAEALVEHLDGGGDAPLPAELSGWRRAAIVDDALDALRAGA